jgi:hypothetical protein
MDGGVHANRDGDEGYQRVEFFYARQTFVIVSDSRGIG